jgi:hypothetical protein
MVRGARKVDNHWLENCKVRNLKRMLAENGIVKTDAGGKWYCSCSKTVNATPDERCAKFKIGNVHPYVCVVAL